jgi:hypothetical protein
VPANRQTALHSINKLIDVANLRSGPEHQLIADLLVGKPFISPPIQAWLNEDQILELFSRVRASGASRLLLHHYGIRLRRAGDLDKSIAVLQEALDVAEDDYRPTERREIVATTLALTRWLQLKERTPDYLEDNPEVRRIRRELRDARTRSRWNPHSYSIEATILRDLASRYQGPKRMELLSEALGLLREGLAASAGTEARLVDGIKEVSEASKGFSEKDAEELFQNFGSGHGYFLLYEQALRSDTERSAVRLLDRALQSKVPCPPAIRAKIDLVLAEGTPDYVEAKKLSDALVNYQASNPGRVSMTWTDHLQRIVCLLGSGDGRIAVAHIAEVRRTAPKNIPQPFPYFLRSGGARAEFRGMVEDVSSAAAGTITSHNIPGFPFTVFFNPTRGKNPARFRRRDQVTFNLAIGVYGITAWDVKLG